MMEWTIWIGIAAIALTAGFIHSAIGFGFGIAAVTMLPWLIDAKHTQVIVSVASVPVMLIAVWNYRQGAELSNLWRAILGAAIAMPLGFLAFVFVSTDLLVRGTGLVILAMVWMNFRNRAKAKRQDQSGGGSAIIAGGIGGFLAGAVSIAAPPVAAFALSQPWDQRQFKAFLNQFLFVVSVYKCGALIVSGYVTPRVLVDALILAPAAWGGIQLGVLASSKLSAKQFQVFVAVALILAALNYVIRGDQ
ncbi:sulfite exporter TauE/SafE family protein [Roseiconus lacunae]|uniref:sulfite exporter TauE/SafE family protein n=1 Tax=Roseiconus lacunae TaxID=2605694 RepID=UPI0011F33B48|nr:sulfite exporter TauE/SafE family protein [Roseiconus lacunae]MCD0463693.1 sulfite exporter TauE/SafE family protein [Roseiconus lacunae]